MGNIRKLRPGTLPKVPHMTFESNCPGTCRVVGAFRRCSFRSPFWDPHQLWFSTIFFWIPNFFCVTENFRSPFPAIFSPGDDGFPAPPRQWPAAIIMNTLVAANTSMSWWGLPERQLEKPNGNQVTVWLMVYIPRDPITETENGNGT